MVIVSKLVYDFLSNYEKIRLFLIKTIKYNVVYIFIVILKRLIVKY